MPLMQPTAADSRLLSTEAAVIETIMLNKEIAQQATHTTELLLSTHLPLYKLCPYISWADAVDCDPLGCDFQRSRLCESCHTMLCSTVWCLHTRSGDGRKIFCHHGTQQLSQLFVEVIELCSLGGLRSWERCNNYPSLPVY